jgi:hypothetical protein
MLTRVFSNGLVFLVGVRLESTFVRRPLFGLLYQPQMMDDDELRAIGGMIDKGRTKYAEKP